MLRVNIFKIQCHHKKRNFLCHHSFEVCVFISNVDLSPLSGDEMSEALCQMFPRRSLHAAGRTAVYRSLLQRSKNPRKDYDWNSPLSQEIIIFIVDGKPWLDSIYRFVLFPLLFWTDLSAFLWSVSPDCLPSTEEIKARVCLFRTQDVKLP